MPPDSSISLPEVVVCVTVNESPAHGRTSDSETRHRALLLRAASRFVRVFQLTAPDAPGLIAFGAEFDPAIADRCRLLPHPLNIRMCGSEAR